MSRLYPLFADLVDRRVLVVGGGAVAERKTRALLDTGARIVVRAPTVTDGLKTLAGERRIAWQRAEFTPDALEGAWLAIAATGFGGLNRRISETAEARHIWVNVVDDAALSGFHVPAVVDRAPLQVAVSSGGQAPTLTTAVRARIEQLLDDSLGPLASLLGRWRERIKRALPDAAKRREFYRRVLVGNVAQAVRANRLLDAERSLKQALQVSAHVTSQSTGRVALVGAGPGDPGLLTRRGFQLLQRADVLLHDRLVSEDILGLARCDALRVPVGKRAGEGGNGQARIHALMVEHARRGWLVVRLKGGDPFVFGRGGEELEYLREREIPYEVVPGITAAIGCAAYAGVPLTHRDYSHAVHWITAHDEAALEDAIAGDDKQTLAVYMGVARLEKLTAGLLARGRSPATPFALIENGTCKNQRVLAGELIDLPARAHARTIHSPALLIVGEVAALAPKLAWFGDDFISARSRLREVA
jgi:uroporphyrin-III C-methyltransferase/precorrin-2 dehydrogenase/sirohydrochlorin ferrochelatase